MKKCILDSSSLLVDGFLLILNDLLINKEIDMFLVDKTLEPEIANLKLLGENIEASKIENIITYLTSIDKLNLIDVKNFFDVNAVKKLINAKSSKVLLITQRESVSKTYESLVNENFKLLKIENNQLINWEFKQEKPSNAFYIKNDIYINTVDTDNIKFDYVYSPKYGYLKLDYSYVKSGGEGTCYRTYDGLFVKIYKSKHINYPNFKKLQAMIECDLGNPYIIWPKDIIYYKGDFIGYVMDELKDVISIDQLRDENFPGFSIIDRFILCRDFLKLIDYLHQKNIIVGDMKFDNIVVDKNKKVYLIDTGSFQIKDYPCNVYNREFTAKEFHGDDLKKNLRSMDDEYFPINKIIFEILILKNPFYSPNNLEIDMDGPKKFNFSLTVPNANNNFREKPPFYLILWYNLSKNMREYFYYYFKEGKITLLSDWIKELDIFINNKQKGLRK